MTNLAKEGKYKIIEYFVDREDYQAFLAIDIEDGARRQVVVNRYRRGEDIRRLIPVFYEVQRCGFSDLADVFTEYGALNVAFRYRGGSKLAQVFGPKTKFSDEFRVHIEEELLHGALVLSSLPPVVLSAAISTDNVLIDVQSRHLYFNLMAPPERIGGQTDQMDAISDMSELVLRRRFYSVPSELDFLDELRLGAYASPTQAYSAWREAGEAMEEERGQLEKSGVMAFLTAFKFKCKRFRRARSYKKRYQEKLARMGREPRKSPKKRRRKREEEPFEA